MEQTAAATAFMDSDYPSPEDVASFIDGRLSAEDRVRLETYFASNPLARSELIGASRIVATLPAPARRSARWIPVAGVAAAAAVMMMLVPGDHGPSPARTVSGQRGVADQLQTVALVSPAEDQSVSGAGSRAFVWRSVGGATYRLIVSDASGKTLLQENTADTVVAMPRVIADNASGIYYWSVDALESDGSSVTSGVRAFTIGKK